MRLYLAIIGFGLVVTIAVCDSMLRVVEEARKRRLQPYLKDDPALARIWDNEDDAIFDDLAQEGGHNGQEAR